MSWLEEEKSVGMNKKRSKEHLRRWLGGWEGRTAAEEVTLEIDEEEIELGLELAHCEARGDGLEGWMGGWWVGG